MTPEEQNAAQARMNVDNLVQRKIGAFKQWKEKADIDYSNQQSAKLENDTMNLYKGGLEATDKETQRKYNVASRGNLLAEMISNKAREEGYEMTGTATEIVSSYLEGFPDAYYPFMDFTHSDQDPEEFAIQMGWMEEPQPKGGFLRNVIGAAGDSATGIGQFLGNGAADIIGWTAKQLGADEDKVNYLVNDFKNYLDNSKISKTVDSNTNSLTYKGTKLATDIAQTAGLGAWAKGGVEAAMGGYPLVTKATPLGVKAAVGALEGAADMGIYDVVAESELPSGKDLALGAGLGAAMPILGAAGKGVKNAIKKGATNTAEDILQNANRMTKGQQTEFAKMMGQSSGKFMNDRGLKTADDVGAYFTKSKATVDNAMEQIEGRFTSKELTDVLEGVDGMEGVVDFAVQTQNPAANRMIELAEKNRNGGLTMSEVQEVKRFFEKHNKFNYGHPERGNSKKFETATNMDNALREWEFKVAEENGFSNLKELNKEIQGSAYILNKSKDWAEGVKGNNLLTLTDWITVMGGGASPSSIAALLGKKAFQTPEMKGKIVDMLNRVAGHENIAEKTADLNRIMEVNNLKQEQAQIAYVNNLYKEWGVGDTTPRLPESVEGGIAAGEKGFVTQNPSAPTFEEMGLQDSRGIKEINTAGQQGTKMYDIANQKYKGIADDIISNGGATLDAASMSKVGGDYYALSLFPNRNRQIPKSEFKDQHVLDYVEDNLDRLLEPGNKLGAWVSPTDMVHLDVSTTLPKKYLNEAKDLAKKYNQEAIYDLGTFEEIPTGGTGEPMDIDEEEVVAILNNLLSK